MGEDSDLEMILEDEVNEDEDIVVLEDKRVANIPKVSVLRSNANGKTKTLEELIVCSLQKMNGGINDPNWNKCRQLFLPTMGIDGMLSVNDTINASIVLLFEVDHTLFSGSLFGRLQGAVVSGASSLTREHLSNNTKKTAYFALTTMHGYGLFPRGFVYLCINLLREDRQKIRKAVEPLKKLVNTMKEQLTFISKCDEKRVSKNKGLQEKCVRLQSAVDKAILWQYPTIFEGVGDTWPEIVNCVIREHEEANKPKSPQEICGKIQEDKYAQARKLKSEGKMATLQSSLQLSHFWLSNTTVWGLNSEVDGIKVVETAIKFIRELNAQLYGDKLIEKVRFINAKTMPLEDKNIYDHTRQHSLRFMEIMERYAVFPKGIAALIIKTLMADESSMSNILDLLRKMTGQVEKILDRMVSMTAEQTSGKSVEKDNQISTTLANMRERAKTELYPLLPSVFAPLRCTRVPSFVAEWMKKSPMTKSMISEWSKEMGVETDLNGFPLKINEEFVMPEMGDEYLVEEEEKKKEKKEKGGKKKGAAKETKESKETKQQAAKKKEDLFRRALSHLPPDSKPISLMDQVISNPFGPQILPTVVITPCMPPPGVPPFLPPPHLIGMDPSLFMGGPPPTLQPPFTGRLPGRSGPPALLDLSIGPLGVAPPVGVPPPPPPSYMGMGGSSLVNTDTSREEDEERRKLEKIARLVMGTGEKRREEETGERKEEWGWGERKMAIRDDEDMEQRERRLQRWLEENNGGRRREERRDERRRRSRSRSRERERDEKGDFERRVEELERRRKEEREERERDMKEICVEHWRKVKGSFKPIDESKWDFRPEWGVTTVWRRVSGHSRWEEKVKDKLDLLSLKIKDHFVNNVQTMEDEEKKKIVLERLQEGIKEKLTACGVFFLMAGSTPSSFASRHSNLDLVLISPVPSMTPDHIRDLFFPQLPFMIAQRGGRMTRQEALWMEFECSMGGIGLGVRIAVDSGAYYFSKIMAVYDTIDKRVSPLLHYIKHWTATHLRRADDISKYLLTNLVIHYLQSGVSPPLLPNLHLLYPARLTPDVFSSFDYVSPFDPPLPQCANSQSLASLFIGFLMYYASFDFSRYAISIRAGGVLRKSAIGVSVPEFAVEHPFDGSFSAVVNDPFTSSHFNAAMAAACQDAITTFDI